MAILMIKKEGELLVPREKAQLPPQLLTSPRVDALQLVNTIVRILPIT